MSYVQGGISPNPLNTNDVSKITGYVTSDLGTAIKNATSKVNPASKYKAFCYNSPGFTSTTDETTARQSKNCGLVMKQYTTITALFTDGVALAEQDPQNPRVGLAWIWDIPRGKANNEWFRAADFFNYNEGALWPWQYGILPNPCYTLDTPTVQDSSISPTADTLTLDDFNGGGGGSQTQNYQYYNLKSKRWGLAIRPQGASGAPSYVKVFSGAPVGAVPTGLTTGNYDVVLFLTKAAATSGWVSGGEMPLDSEYYLAPTPHTVWRNNNNAGFVYYPNTTINAARTQINLSVYSISTNRTYQKLMMVVKNLAGTTDLETYTLESTSGQIKADASNPYTKTINKTGGGSWPDSGTGQVRFYLRFWITSTQAAPDDEFVPAPPLDPNA